MNAPPVYVAQRDFAVGDIAANRDKLIAASRAAKQKGAAVAVAPELALSGYPPEDMLYDSSFAAAINRAVEDIAANAEPSVALLFGAPLQNNGALYNCAMLVREGKTEGTYSKAHLPNFSVFDERRYFSEGGGEPLTFAAGGEKFAVQVCEDIWHNAQAARVKESGAAHTLSLNASPFYMGKQTERVQAAAEFARQSQTSVLYCHLVGGQDELIFDGASFAVDKSGKLTAQMPAFDEAEGLMSEHNSEYPASEDAVLYGALVLAVRDYLCKTGFNGAVLGLSGGVDSALVAVLAADAIGAENVLTVMMPSQYTSRESVEDAAAIASNLKCQHLTLPINEMTTMAQQTLSPHFVKREGDVAMENVQARLRGMLLMALANNRGHLLLATGNKSEAACGYATLYGDMCGGFAPLKDLSKTRVWRLAKHRNIKGEVIPPRVIERAPSAELKPNQTDQDSLPPYDVVDAIVSAHLERRSPREEMRREFDSASLSRVLSLLSSSEHKRRQAAIGPKLTQCAFGRDWRMPVANRFRGDAGES